MKLDLKKMKYQAGQLPCCLAECISHGIEKNCEPNPLDCTDFFFYNFDEIQEQKRGKQNEKKEIND